MSITLSPNMSLPVPGVGTEDGPQWATDINNCLSILDAHNHSAGSGVQIPTSGININADLSINTQNLYTIRSARFDPQGAPIGLGNDLGCVYVAGVDLYYNDVNGNQIQITSGGGVAGSPGSIGSLTAPATATYSAGSKVFIWESGVSKSAAMDNGAITIRETDVTSANGVTIASPTALAADYQLTLPAALPGSTSYLTSSSGGSLSFTTPDGVAAAITNTGANTIASNINSWTPIASVANSIADARTRTVSTSVGAGGVAISSDCGNFTTTSTSYVDITNLSVTITSTGRPIYIGLISSGASLDANNATEILVPTGQVAHLNILRDATQIADFSTTNGLGNTLYQVDTRSHVDPVAAGTYTYKCQYKVNTGTGVVRYFKLVAYEL